MKQVAAMGLDIAKHVFQAHGVDKAGWVVLKRKLQRHEVAGFFGNLEPCVVGIEASGSAHYWARVLRAAGHTVRLMAPQFVKPYVKSNKNDANDAEAIAEAVMRPNMRFVSPKSVEQQDMQCLHRVRSRLVADRQPGPVRPLYTRCATGCASSSAGSGPLSSVAELASDHRTATQPELPASQRIGSDGDYLHRQPSNLRQ